MYELIDAAQAGNTDQVRRLLTAPDIAVNHADKNGNTALIWAVLHGYTEVVTALLAAAGIDFNHANKHGCTALYIAASSGQTDVVAALLAENGIAVNLAALYDDTALIAAAFKGHTGIVKALLAVPGIDVNLIDADGYTALAWAENLGRKDIIVALQARALGEAASGGHIEVVKALLAAGADVNHADTYGDTAPALATKCRHKGVVTAINCHLFLKKLGFIAEEKMALDNDLAKDLNDDLTDFAAADLNGIIYHIVFLSGSRKLEAHLMDVIRSAAKEVPESAVGWAASLFGDGIQNKLSILAKEYDSQINKTIGKLPDEDIDEDIGNAAMGIGDGGNGIMFGL